MKPPPRLSPIESIMWRVGHDPVLRMTVGALLVFDGVPPRDDLLERLDQAAKSAPRITWRPSDPSRSHARVGWVADPFDPQRHVRSLAVPAPGGFREVLDLAALLASTPFELDRPPWDVTVIEGFDAGKAALYLRADHVVTDGLGGASLASLLFDAMPASSPPEPTPSPEPATTEPATVEPAATEPTTNGNGAAESPVEPSGEARLGGTVTVSFDVAKVAQPIASGVSAGMNALVNLDPLDTLVRVLQRGLNTANSVSRQLMITDGPYALLPAGHSSTSRFEVLSVPGARRVALSLGGSRNDLLVAAAAVGFGRYLAATGQVCPQLRLASPSSRQRPTSLGGNSFAPTRVVVPTAGGHPGPQFGVVAERLIHARHEPAVRLTDALATTICRLPSRVLVPALHAQAGSIDFVASALPGLRRVRSLGGARLEAAYPFGPRLGCPVNLTAFGNGNDLDIGIALDPVAIEDPDALVACLAAAFEEYTPRS